MPDTLKNGQSAHESNLSKLVGNTPLIALKYRYKGGESREILVKCEQYNLTKSIKDRLVLYTLQKASFTGKLKTGDLIVDACRDNMGISIAAIGRALGHRVKIIMPDTTDFEIRAVIKGYGADLQLVSAADGGFDTCVKFADAMAFHDGIYLPRQLAAAVNVETHERTTGREIGHYLLLERIKPAAFVAGAGTGSTLLGVGKYLAAMYPEVLLRPVWAAEGEGHRIKGFCEVIKAVPGLGAWIEVNDGDAILMAQKLAQSARLPVGISSGANFLGAVKTQLELRRSDVVITIFPDGSRHYPILEQNEAVRTGYLSPDIEVLDYKVLDKV